MLLALSISDVVFIMLVNIKMPTIVGILTFMSRINLVLSWVEYEKSFKTFGPALGPNCLKRISADDNIRNQQL